MSVKKKACRVCRKKFTPWNSLVCVCSIPCSIILTNRKKAAKAKQQKKADRLKREALRPMSWYVKKAQAAFNTYVRERDSNQPCISCGRFHNGKYDAGHYLTTGARAELRFHPMNCHRQCVPCNQHLHGNLILYRKNLIKRIGAEMVEYLENFNNPQKWTVEDLKEIAQHYKDELKHLKEVSR